jgi:hypothetical protein
MKFAQASDGAGNPGTTPVIGIEGLDAKVAKAAVDMVRHRRAPQGRIWRRVPRAMAVFELVERKMKCDIRKRPIFRWFAG